MKPKLTLALVALIMQSFGFTLAQEPAITTDSRQVLMVAK
jgi:hypothetical protein